MTYNIEDIYKRVSFLKGVSSLTGMDFEGIEQDKDCIYEHGISKGVIIPDDTDYVIKIPFSGYHYEDEEENENEEINFYHGGGNYDDDYCALEMEIYDNIKDSKYSKYFAPLKKVLEINGFNIYIQPKVDIFDDVYPSYSDSSLETAKRISSSAMCCIVSSAWLAYLLENDFNNDEKELEKFVYFLTENGLDGDLHSANVGFIDGQSVVIDYAGFYD